MTVKWTRLLTSRERIAIGAAPGFERVEALVQIHHRLRPIRARTPDVAAAV